MSDRKNEDNDEKRRIFRKNLRARLSQTMSQQEVTAQIRYYENYIQEQMQNGRSEEEVLTELGDPLLIAKSTDGRAGDAGRVQSPGDQCL